MSALEEGEKVRKGHSTSTGKGIRRSVTENQASPEDVKTGFHFLANESLAASPLSDHGKNPFRRIILKP